MTTKDGYTAKQYREALEKRLNKAHKRIVSGHAIKRNNRVVVVVTDLTLDRIRMLGHRNVNKGISGMWSISSVANDLILRSLSEAEAEASQDVEN